ncbi:hypothetical protein ACIQXF_18455 [Lysinibacillus sp. NPDC097231]|uniref:hypothetical protein n=1 Tax=Lysinibacillus sp. NPDC097231 TaxID=3364142 RepID=UPI00381D8C7A
MAKSSEDGKAHVLTVYASLLNNISYPTANYIKQLYPNIKSIVNKYQTNQPDQHPDLLLILQNEDEVKINLFSIGGKSSIQPKNLGAKSFLTKYFNSEALQKMFNVDFEHELKAFYREIVSRKEQINEYDTTTILRSKVKGYFPKFTNEINPLRRAFLAQIRDNAFYLLTEAYNAKKGLLEETFRILMMTDSINIVSRHNKEGIYKVEQWQTQIDFTKSLFIYKKGNDTVGLRIGEHALTLRFKFESRPFTSIKIATSFEYFPEDAKVLNENLQSIEAFEKKIEQHVQTCTKNSSNAIGKCNEAIVYYQLLKTNPSLQQVEESAYQGMMTSYSSIVAHDVLLQIVESSVITREKIEEYFANKYGEYQLQSIQLVPESYIKDRLDTTDLKIILIANGQYIEEGLSLKAIATKNVKITVKNPGAGQILGPLYFNIGSLVPLLDELKQQFDFGKKNHRECLEEISAEFGQAVGNAELSKLQIGLVAILGNATKVVTMYKQNDCRILEYSKTIDNIKIYQQTPSTIQTTFICNDGELKLTLRAKYSAGQSKGWSSVKFVGEMGI